ncbi:MAG: hypothetical protein GC205_10160 [Bacteroidetes bacterium]|nr:hypothetical protein [Bacteroidota bacterium]
MKGRQRPVELSHSMHYPKSLRIPLTFRSFGGDGGHLLVDTWWKQMPVPLIIDTGATHSLLHAGLFLDSEGQQSTGQSPSPQINASDSFQAVQVLGGGGRVPCPQEPMLVAGMRIGVVQLPALYWGLIDLGVIRNQYRENRYPPPCGLIGLDVLRRMNAVIQSSPKQSSLKIKYNYME